MKKGFTLIELMTAVSIFAVVMVISMGSILGIFDANRKSRSLKTVINNLNLAVESISKEMRFGKKFHCGSSGTLELPQNCPNGDSFVSFKSTDGPQITYRLNGQTIEKSVDNSDYIALTAPELIIDELTFYVLGSAEGDGYQPKVLMRVKAHAGSGRGRSDFTLQTLISQRVLDL